MDVSEAIRVRRSVRAYQATPIPAPVREQLLEALRLAPSACNHQPWKFIVVDDPAVKARVVTACKKQTFVGQAPLIIVGCGYPEQAYKTMGGYGNSIDVDLAIALDHLTLAAATHGLGTCWIGAFDETAVKAALQIPPEVKVVALMPVGYPSDPTALTPQPQRRKPVEAVVSHNTFR